jgi:hypothetical protein
MKKAIRKSRTTRIASLLVVLGGVVTAGCAIEPLDSESASYVDMDAARTVEQELGSTLPRADVSNWTGLVGMASNGNYRLTANINASGKTWTPKAFSGTFDGNGKTISNLTINVAGDAGFFGILNQAIVKNVKFTNLNVTGTWMVGGLASLSQDSQVERVAVEGTITATNGFAVGGIFGEMIGGTLHRSYAKGTAQSALFFAGGLAGFLGQSSSQLATVTRSYAQVTVIGDTSNASRTVNAGGIAGRANGADIHEVIAVGNVTGRGGVGGLVGYLDCQNYAVWMLYKGIYRGDVVDKNAPSGGWSGTVGGYGQCTARFANLFWDSTLDPSSNWLSNSEADLAQHRGTTTELRSPTTLTGGIYCMPDVVPGRCGDNNFDSSIWSAGSASQHHTLRYMPGPNVLPR